MLLMAVKWSRKPFGFVIIQSFTVVEGNVKFLTSYVKGSLIDGQRKGYHLCQKWYMKRMRGWILGRSLPE